MSRRDPLTETLARLSEVQADPHAPGAAETLHRALADRSNLVVARAAEIVAEWELADAAPDLIAAFDHFLIDPLGACVFQVRLERRIRGHLAASHRACLDEGPRPVADRRDRLALVNERSDKLHGRRVHAKFVGTHHPTGQQQRVVVLRLRPLQRNVGRKLLAPLRVVPPLDFAG